jgi:intracellular sulfur oxidation DsrE/DsrF family protein
VITGQPSASSPSEAITNKPKANASSKVTASKSKAKPSSQTIAGQRGASASPKVIAAKPKGNASSKVTANKPKANPSSKAIAGQPKANLKLIASTAKAHPASGVPSGKTTANPAANPSVANANAAMPVRPHRLVIQVDQNDPAVMNLALNNATNVIDYYRAKQQDVQVDLVTYGPGLNMLRDDTSPVKDRIKQLKDYAFPSTVQFSACTNTKENMEKKEGKPISIVSDAVLVPSGVVHLMELQESGWSYVRP